MRINVYPRKDRRDAEDTADLISTLQRQEDELVLDSFDHGDAWTLGVGLVALAQAAGHAVGIDIRRPGLILFRAALPGITPDQDSWIARKAARPAPVTGGLG